ncbi:hypothetical protein P167DRAFT_580679 [Morchella conica CCBAS932]|uniref:Uncharacterized protein n=1 Tax=Morchella conica CCBAS932 TaxID=1392247 RepID=A0A3N4K727_9PEZI|nr:hypothetical protein P167DRAFT_580679 [Morchella conica CCBAS932]
MIHSQLVKVPLQLALDELVMRYRDDVLERKDVICVLSTSFDEKIQGGRRVTPRRPSTGKQKSWGIWGIWSIWSISGAQLPQDDMSFFADGDIKMDFDSLET